MSLRLPSGAGLKAVLCAGALSAFVFGIAVEARAELPFEAPAAGSRAEQILVPILDMLDAMAAENGAEIMRVSAPVTAVEQGDAVTVTFPGLELDLGNGDALKVGDFAFNVSPREGERFFVEGALPSPMEGIDGTGAVQAEITLARGTWAGEWFPDLLSFGDLKIDMKDFKVALKDDGTGAPADPLIIGSLVADQTLEERSPADVDFSGRWQIESIKTISDGVTVAIGGVTLSGGLTRFDLDGLRTFYRESGLAAAPFATPENLNVFSDMFNALEFEAINSKAEVTNVSVEGPEGPMGGLARFTSTMAFATEETADRARLGMTLGMEGLDAMEMPVPQAFVPSAAELGFTAQALPVSALYELLMASAQAEADGLPPPAEPDAPLVLMADAGTHVTVDSLSVTTPTLKTSGTGRFDVNLEAVHALVGSLGLTIVGLDAAMTEASSGQAEGAAEILPVLLMAKGYGEKEGEGDSYKFDVALNAEGLVTINGKPLPTGGEGEPGMQEEGAPDEEMNAEEEAPPTDDAAPKKE